MRQIAWLLAAAVSFSGVMVAPVQAADKPAVLTIGTKGDEMAFDKTTLTAKAGQTIKLTFTNHASKASGLEHNWVLTQIGKSDAVGQASIAAGPDKGWLAMGPDVLAHVPMQKAGESKTIEFKAPSKAGDYPFICTFPGHYMVMKGVLKVK